MMRDAVEVFVSKENPNDDFVILLEWKYPSGREVDKDALIAVVESSKAVYDVHAPAKGLLFYQRAVGDKLPFGEPIAFISKDKGFRLPKLEESASVLSPDLPSYTRKARKLMEERGIDPSVFEGRKKVKEEDVRHYVENRRPDAVRASSSPLVREVRSLPASKVFEIQSLQKSADEVIYSNAVRQFPFSKVQEVLSSKTGQGSSVSLGALLVNACARCLSEFDYLNAFYTAEGAQIYGRVNIGVAMNLGKGLKVPVLFDADQMSLTETNDAMNDHAMRYMRDELKVSDMANGTFTVSDLSSLGVSFFTPLVNYAQAAILGVCSKDSGGDFFNVILAFDHRLAEGMYAARFLERVEEVTVS